MQRGNETNEYKSWPDMAIGLYDRLTGRGAEITYELEDVTVQVPSGTGSRDASARWNVNGTVRIRTRDQARG